MNREVRRALERSGKAAPKRPARKVITINPMFALDVSARNRQAATERKAMDAILEHCATKDDIEQIETLIFALRQRPPFDGDGDLLRALRAMKHDARRASRGETARAADTLGPGIGGEPIKIRPTTTKDPSQ